MGKITGVAKKPNIYISKKDGAKTIRWKVYWTPYSGAEKKIYSWVESPTRQEAFYERQKLIAKQTERLIASDSPPDDFSKMLQTLLSNIEADGKSKKYVSRHRDTFQRLYRDFKAKYEEKHNTKITDLRQLDSGYFAEYQNYFVNELKRPKGWRVEVIILKNQLKRLRRFKFCDRDLVEDVKESLPTPEGIGREYAKLSQDEMDKLFTYIKKNRPDYYRPIRFMYLTGRRLTETTLFQKNDLDHDGNRLPITLRPKPKNTKTKRKSVIYLRGELKPLITDALQNNKTEWLFINRQGHKCGRDRIYKYLARASEKVLKKHINPHYFRHRFHQENMSISMKDAMAISGLTSVSVAMKYYDDTSAERQAIILEKRKRK